MPSSDNAPKHIMHTLQQGNYDLTCSMQKRGIEGGSQVVLGVVDTAFALFCKILLSTDVLLHKL